MTANKAVWVSFTMFTAKCEFFGQLSEVRMRKSFRVNMIIIIGGKVGQASEQGALTK